MASALRSVIAAVVVGAAVLPATMFAGSPVAAASVAGSPVAGASPAHRSGPAGVIAGSGELVNVTSGKWLWSRGLNSEHPSPVLPRS